jgi:hypothetical protein
MAQSARLKAASRGLELVRNLQPEEEHMSTMTSVFGTEFPLHRDEKRFRATPDRGVSKKRWREALVIAAATALAIFTIAAPLAGNPQERLFALDQAPGVLPLQGGWFEAPSRRPFDLSPGARWIAVDTSQVEAAPVLIMPELAVRGIPPV